jgi:hypothetical protein
MSVNGVVSPTSTDLKSVGLSSYLGVPVKPFKLTQGFHYSGGLSSYPGVTFTFKIRRSIVSENVW